MTSPAGSGEYWYLVGSGNTYNPDAEPTRNPSAHCRKKYTPPPNASVGMRHNSTPDVAEKPVTPPRNDPTITVSPEIAAPTYSSRNHRNQQLSRTGSTAVGVTRKRPRVVPASRPRGVFARLPTSQFLPQANAGPAARNALPSHTNGSPGLMNTIMCPATTWALARTFAPSV